jgi:UDP-N-acetylmuramoyl-L-alanyl-D-glutamate--2,6-diaminopimelate ligase
MGEIPEAEAKGDPQLRILGIACHSRQVGPGFLFVAIKGAINDGNRYLAEALARGAVALASEEDMAAPEGVARLKVRDARRFLAEASRVFYGDPASQMKLVALTGTNGKTTSCYLIDAVLQRAGLHNCLVGTLGMRIRARCYPTIHTTPEATELTRFLRLALDSGCTHGVLEVSSHALASKRVFGIRFCVGVFSNLTPEHLDFHGDMESYYTAKRLLFTSPGRNRVELAVINADDPYGERLIREAECPVLRYGVHHPAEVQLVASRRHIDGTDIQITTPQGTASLHTHLIGAPNIYNVLSAAGASLGLGIDLNTIRDGIESLTGVAGRLERVEAGQDFTVVVDYAHTPDALEKLLETVAELPHDRIITVFGCGGDRDRQKRPLMGEIAGRLSHHVVATSDNPRTEDPLQILAEIEPGLQRAVVDYRIEPDRRCAISHALSAARQGDVVVIAGKGHEDYQIIGTQVLPFDDRVVARELIMQLQNPEGARDRGELHQ